ncbi:MAG: hypothetical protein ACSLFK_04215 [Gemmatimonadaceae bacterium]
MATIVVMEKGALLFGFENKKQRHKSAEMIPPRHQLVSPEMSYPPNP